MWSSHSTSPFIWSLFQLMGLYQLPKPIKTSKTLRPWVFTTWLCCLVLVSTLIFTYTVVYRRSLLYSDDDIGYINELLKYGCLVATSYMVLGEAFIKRKNHSAIWGVISRLKYHSKLDQVKLEFNKRYTFKFYVYFLTFVLIEIRVSTATLAVADSWFLIWLVSLLPQIISRTMCLLHIYYIDLLASFLQFIREELDDIVKYSKYSLYVTVDRSHLTVRLAALKHMYGQLYDMLNMVNDTFVWSQVLNFTYYFLHCICDLHWFYKTFGYAFPIMGFSFVPLIICFGSLTYSANACTQQAKGLLPLLHQVRCSYSEEAGLSRLVRQFAIQLGHEAFRFCGYDLYSIDYGLLKTMIASITTFMLIFIQMTPDEEKLLLTNQYLQS